MSSPEGRALIEKLPLEDLISLTLVMAPKLGRLGAAAQAGECLRPDPYTKADFRPCTTVSKRPEPKCPGGPGQGARGVQKVEGQGNLISTFLSTGGQLLKSDVRSSRQLMISGA